MDDSRHHLSVAQADCPKCGETARWGSMRSYRGFRAFLCRDCDHGLFVMACHTELNSFFAGGEKSS